MITTELQHDRALSEQLADDARRADRALELTGFNVEYAVQAYLEAQLWTQHDELYPEADNEIEEVEGVDRSEHGEMMDAFYSPDDIDSDYVDSVRAEIVDFVAAHPLAVRLYLGKRSSGDFGEDFLLTRDGCGVGFWDRGLGAVGNYLSLHTRPYGDSGYLYDGALCSDPRGARTFEPGILYGP